MPYNSLVSRTDVAGLIPVVTANEILNSVAEMNPLMRLARRLPNMSTGQTRMPVISALATAYFVSGDTGLKNTSEVNWENKYIDAEEIAVIVPIAQSVLDDASFDIWAAIKPEIQAAFSVAISNAVLFGTNIPASWTTDLGAAGLYAVCVAASQTASIAAYTDLYEALLGEKADGTDGSWMQVEADGFMVTGAIAHPSMKGKLRNCRDADGNKIFTNTNEIEGAPVYFPTDGTMAAATALMFSGQWDQMVYAMRQDITYKVLDQAVIQDGSGAIVYNLAQQDMVALRCVARLGFALPNPINRMQATAASRCAFSALTA
jgi:HK97 family phage major capsid protein